MSSGPSPAHASTALEGQGTESQPLVGCVQCETVKLTDWEGWHYEGIAVEQRWSGTCDLPAALQQQPLLFFSYLPTPPTAVGCVFLRGHSCCSGVGLCGFCSSPPFKQRGTEQLHVYIRPRPQTFLLQSQYKLWSWNYSSDLFFLVMVMMLLPRFLPSEFFPTLSLRLCSVVAFLWGGTCPAAPTPSLSS